VFTVNAEEVGSAEEVGFARARAKVKHALAAMASGDPHPYIDCWAKLSDITLFGAWGPNEQGYQGLVNTFRWVGGRFTSGALVPQDVVAFASGDLAYTVGYERGDVSVDAGGQHTMVLRVTHIYRRIDDEWQLVHRHADLAPHDERRT
jgi:ketosteroid isomerase-like protein